MEGLSIGIPYTEERDGGQAERYPDLTDTSKEGMGVESRELRARSGQATKFEEMKMGSDPIFHF